MKETDYQGILGQYIRTTRMLGYFELKVARADTFTFGRVEDHQYDGLQATEETGLFWKYSDADMRQKPCDCSCTPPLPSYLVIHYPNGYYYFIRIGEIVKLYESGATGLHWQDAAGLCEKMLKLA